MNAEQSDLRSLSSEARRLSELARAAGFGDSPDSALQLGREAIAMLTGDAETPLLADVLRWQGSVMRERGQTSAAEPLYQRSLGVAERLGYDAGRAHALNSLASLAQRRGDLAAAGNLINDALALAARCGETRLVGMLQQNLGILADIRGNPSAALAYYRVSLHTFEESNDLQPMCWVLNNLGLLLLKEEEFDEAHRMLDRALGIARARGDMMAEGIVEENRAELYLTEGHIDEGYASLVRALDVAETRGDDMRKAAALKLRGAHERLSGRPADAVNTLQYALTLSAVTEDALLGAEVLYQFAMALSASGDASTADQVWLAALDAFERIAARQWVTRVRERLSGVGSGRYL